MAQHTQLQESKGQANGSQLRSDPLEGVPADAQALLKLIAHLSRVTATIATNITLAKHLARGRRTISRHLGTLNRRKLIIRVRKVPREYRPGREDKKQRVIYLVAQREDEVGAAQVAKLARKWRGAEGRHDDEFCGRLQCAPKQFQRWLKMAIERGWVRVLLSRDGKRVFKVGKKVPRTTLPSTFSKKGIVEGKPKTLFTLGAPARHSARQALIEILEQQLNHRVAVTMTDEELRRHPSMPAKTSRSTLQQALRKLISDGRYFRYLLPKGYGRGRLICAQATNAGSLANYAALLLRERVQPPKRRRGRPRTAAPRLGVGEVRKRLVELSAATGRRADRFTVTSAEITAALAALKLTGPCDHLDALERVAWHLLSARTRLQPTLPTGPTLTFQLIDPLSGARIVVGDLTEPAPEDAAILSQVEESAVSGLTADGKIWFVDPATGAKTIPE